MAHTRNWLQIVSFALAVGLSQAVLITNQVIPSQKYDFIVIGGGNAGSVIANRLSENPAHNVLLIESGPSEVNFEDVSIPFVCNTLSPYTAYDWNYTTTPQVGLSGRSIPYPRGHILGGTSSINYLIYTRGSAEDFDRYATSSGDDGWAWNNVQQYIMKNEKYGPPVDGHDTTGQFDPAFHSTSGVNGVSLAGFATGIDGRVINASSQLGGEFAYKQDQNSGLPLGLGWVQTTTSGRYRSSAATSYLAPQYLSRSNLFVVVGLRVSRVLQTGTEDGLPVFRTVEILGPGLSVSTITATKEVILSAGAIGSPKILMSSGIGDTKELEALNITTLVNLPSVGKNLTDHPFADISWFVSGTDTYDDFYRDPTVRTALIRQWENQGQGRLVDTIASHLIFARLPASILSGFSEDPAAGPNSPHYELLIANGDPFPPFSPTGHFLSMGLAVVQPTSVGSVTLRSKNAADPPFIDPRLLSTIFDKVALRHAVRSAFKFVSAPAFFGYIIAPNGPLTINSTDAEIDAFLAANGGTIFHPVGSAKMSKSTDSFGVVNPDLKVKNVVGLRVIDASVLPFLPSMHTQVPVYIFAEKGSDLIKADWPHTAAQVAYDFRKNMTLENFSKCLKELLFLGVQEFSRLPALQMIII